MRLGICGLGLIGSSVARGLPGSDLVALDPDPAVAAAAPDLGVTMVPDLAAMADRDLILLCAPTAVNDALLGHLMTHGPRVATADLGSVKEPIVRRWSGDPSFPFVGTHPMAGSERAGVAAGTADLFAGSYWAVVVDQRTDPVALASVVELVLSLGAAVVPVSPDVHDDTVAAVSHLPHLLAGVLGEAVAESAHRRLALQLAAGSFRDATRVSGSPPQRTAEFVSANAAPAAAAARAAAARLTQMADLVASADARALAEQLAVAHTVHDRPPERVDHVAAPDLRAALLALRDTGAAVTACRDGMMSVRSATP